MSYLQLIEAKFAEYLAQENEASGGHQLPNIEDMRFAFMAENFFGIDMGGSDFTGEAGRWAIEVAVAIDQKRTYQFIQKSDEHCWYYLLMLNLPFFQEKTTYGVSISGSFWDLATVSGKVKVFQDTDVTPANFKGLVAALALWSGVVS